MAELRVVEGGAAMSDGCQHCTRKREDLLWRSGLGMWLCDECEPLVRADREAQRASAEPDESEPVAPVSPRPQRGPHGLGSAMTALKDGLAPASPDRQVADRVVADTNDQATAQPKSLQLARKRGRFWPAVIEWTREPHVVERCMEVARMASDTQRPKAERYRVDGADLLHILRTAVLFGNEKGEDIHPGFREWSRESGRSDQWLQAHVPLLVVGGLLIDTGRTVGRHHTKVYVAPVDEALPPIGVVPPKRRPQRRARANQIEVA